MYPLSKMGELQVNLAGEAGLPYAAIALSTDYDCWKEHEESVSVDSVLAVLKANVESATKLLTAVIPKIANSQVTPLTTKELLLFNYDDGTG